MLRVAFLTVLLVGCKSTAPCAVDATEVDFGEVEAASVTRRFVTVTNSSDVDHVITARPMIAPFSVEPGGAVRVQAHSAETFALGVAPFDNLLHHDELLIESDGACDFAIPVRALGSGLVTVTPEKLEFTLGAGERETKELVIQSTRRNWTSVLLRWDASPGETLPFSLSETSVRVEAASTRSVAVTAAPRGWEEVHASLLITAPSGQVRIPVTITPSSPRLEITPSQIELPVVGLGPTSQPPEFAQRLVRVRNTGTSRNPGAPSLGIVSIDGSPELELTAPALPLALAEGEFAEVAVRLVPRAVGGKRLRVSMLLDPPQLVQISFTTVAELLPACTLSIEPAGSSLQLQGAADGGLEGSVTFTNTGNTRCVVDDLRLTDAPELAFDARSQIELPPDGGQRVTITGSKVDAGMAGAFGFHVFGPNSDQQWIELRAP